MLPAASAGATFHEAITSGKFHGVIRPTTPSGSRKVMSTPPATGIVWPEQALGRAGVVAEASRATIPISPRASAIGLPALRASSVASSSASASSASARPRSSVARSPGATARQAGNAAFARGDRGVGLLEPRPAGSRPSPRSVAGSITCDHARRSPAPGDGCALAPPRRAPRSPGSSRPPRCARATPEREAPARAARSPRSGRPGSAQPRRDEALAELGRRPGGGGSGRRAARRPAARAGERAGLEPHLVVAEAARAVCDVPSSASARCWSSVPPQGDVEQLHPAADPEHRHVALQRPPRPARSRSGRARARCPWSRGSGSAP